MMNQLPRPTRLRSLMLAATVLAGTALPPLSASAQDFDPEALMDAMEKRSGTFAGYRRAHSKGMCGRGTFKSSGDGAALSEASMLQAGAVSSVTFRFSDAAGNPFMDDRMERVRAMGLIIQAEDGEEWRTAMNSFPMFMVKDAAGFADFVAAQMPDPKTGKPDPTKLPAFLQKHPEALRMFGFLRQNPPSKSFATSFYNSVNAFFFVTADGKRTPVRWEVLPDAGFQPLDPASLKTASADYLFDGLQADVSAAPVTWTIVAQIGEPGDDTTDPTTPWPADRKKVTLGTLTLSEAGPSLDAVCDGENIDPMFLPTGIEPSEDPILYARSAAYAASFSRRYTEREEGNVAKKPE